MNVMRKLRMVGVVVTALVATTLPMAGQAQAATSCYGTGCTGKNPSATVCASDGRTIMSREVKTGTGESVGILELRYSPRCYSNWVRFTPWSGWRSILANWAGNASFVSGDPWIWRKGVANSLQGYAGSSSPYSYSQTVWSKMVTAAGTTCTSVGIYEKLTSSSGQGETIRLGTYNAPCVS